MRGAWLYALGALGIVGFVLTARAEPSVVRAAAMGTVALVGMGRNGRSRGVRGLGVAVLGLLLFRPQLAVTAGFALSALATAGILLLAPVWRDALMRWTPRWVAEAVSVPLAAQTLGLRARETLVVEDSPIGVAAARAAGMRTIALTTTHARDELGGATLVVDSFDEIDLDDWIR